MRKKWTKRSAKKKKEIVLRAPASPRKCFKENLCVKRPITTYMMNTSDAIRRTDINIYKYKVVRRVWWIKSCKNMLCPWTSVGSSRKHVVALGSFCFILTTWFSDLETSDHCYSTRMAWSLLPGCHV